MVDRLLEQSHEFSELWERHDVLLQDCEAKRLHSPLVALHLSFVSTEVPDTGHRLTAMSPRDEDALQKLEKLGRLA